MAPAVRISAPHGRNNGGPARKQRGSTTAMETVQIKKVVYGGLGLAHHDGKALFIPYTAPGDVVEFTIDKEKKKVLFGTAVRIVEPSPGRVDPECPVFGECGGCHLLHMRYSDELEIKKQTLLENLERIGNIRTGLGQCIPSPERFGYRNHAQIKVDGEGHCGFAARESSRIVPFPPEGCRLLSPGMRKAIAGLPREALPPGGEIRAREDRYGTTHFWGLLERSGPPDLLMEVSGFIYPVAPDSFFQVNSLLNSRLIELVLALPRKTRRRLLDLYCGVGFFTLPLSRIVGEAIGVEKDPAAVRSANAALRLNKIINVTYRKGAVEQVIARVRDVDLLLADPPRSGIPDKALRRIVKLRPAELIIASCEPPTFARDARVLIEAGYFLTEIDLIDLFPGTYHVEIVSLFRRNS
jgi:23S rRNA (uracil1939-C5)-methyltransferase